MRADFADRYGPWAVIAGASEGIGACFARRIAAAGVHPVLVARNEAKLRALAADLPVESRVAAVDLTAPDVLDALAPAFDGIDVGLLVYNAGAMHGTGLFVDRPVEDALHLVNLNCRTVVQLTHALGGAMAARRRGGIVLMTSMAGAAGSGYTAVYAATKSFDLVLAEGLWMELGQYGVDVIAVPAGLTDTPAMRRSGIISDDGGAMDPDVVAATALDALGTSGPMVVPEELRPVASFLWPGDRTQSIQAMTDGASALYGVPAIKAPR